MERRKRKLSGSTTAKVIAFFLLAASFLTGIAGVAGCVAVYAEGVGSREDNVKAFLWSEAQHDLDIAMEYVHGAWDDSWNEEYFSDRNSGVEIFVEDKKVWSCYDGKKTAYRFVRMGNVIGRLVREGTEYRFENGELDEIEDGYLEYTIYLYVDDEFPVADGYRIMAQTAGTIYDMRTIFPAAVIISSIVFALCFIFLMCAAGHRNGREGITPGVLSELPFDLVTVAFGFVGIAGMAFFLMLADENFWAGLTALLVVGTLEVVWGTIYCMEFAQRLKLGKFWRNTLLYMILSAVLRAVKWLFRKGCVLVRGIPLIAKTIVAFCGISFAEMIVCLFLDCSASLLAAWFLEKLILFPIVLYVALICKKLQKASEALAKGNLNYHVNTAEMIFDLKEHGQNLNHIGEGIAAAVEERMRSERLKTELITNVTHDLKTPLTSIINYAELLGGEGLEPEQISEYSEVLLRQSRRLKKLLEDLVEASKATTGNLEVNLTPCEISVLLSQVVGEYEQKFDQKGLQLIMKQSGEPVRILADGRYLWRAMDNLMNNIYKYAQENTRVYLTVEEKGGFVQIILRNMSKYALEATGEELEERFVRGDKSRHMEGNGLGLSIAKSLVELQKGSMEIVIDGDLFKVVLQFPILQE